METGTPHHVSEIPENMSYSALRQIKQALTNLNPAEVRELASRPVRVGLVASSQEALGRMESYLVPAHLTAPRRAEASRMLIRGSCSSCDIEIYENSLL